jgi:peptidoglycan-N-acetylglucosamine deacetylase
VKTYVVFAFDMETDIGSYLNTYNGVQRGTDRILAVLRKYGVPATFLFTGDTALNNRDVVEKVARLGFEVGCHSLRHETVGEARFNMPGDRPILETEVENRLRLNKKIVQDASGIEPRTFRAPRLWQGHAQIAALEKLGFTVDASYSVAAHGTHILPYHPSAENWLEPGDMSLLVLPNFAFLDNRNDYSKFFCKNDQWPLLRLLGAEFVFENQKDVIERQGQLSDISVLLFYLHPWEYEPMPETYQYDEGTFIFKPELVQNCGEAMARSFERYVQLCRDEGFQFATCSDFARVWEEQGHGAE